MAPIAGCSTLRSTRAQRAMTRSPNGRPSSGSSRLRVKSSSHSGPTRCSHTAPGLATGTKGFYPSVRGAREGAPRFPGRVVVLAESVEHGDQHPHRGVVLRHAQPAHEVADVAVLQHGHGQDRAPALPEALHRLPIPPDREELHLSRPVRRGVHADRRQIPQHAEAVLGVVERHPLDQAGQGLPRRARGCGAGRGGLRRNSTGRRSGLGHGKGPAVAPMWGARSRRATASAASRAGDSGTPGIDEPHAAALEPAVEGRHPPTKAFPEQAGDGLDEGSESGSQAVIRSPLPGRLAGLFLYCSARSCSVPPCSTNRCARPPPRKSPRP